MENPIENPTHRTAENIATFGGIFVVSQVAEFIGNQIHNPNIMVVPEDGFIALGLVLAGISTAVVDHVAHRRNQS
jgi:hypothetical protein